jgi:hypothetical protein
MTQSFNLSQLANNLDSSGRLDAADGLVNAVPLANGGTGATSASAARTNLDVAQAVYAVPSGGIIMWSGSVASIPVGWLLCNGASGTPDLRDRFLIGAGSTYGVGTSGGSANAIVVSHSHSITSQTTGNQSADHVHADGTGGAFLSYGTGPEQGWTAGGVFSAINASANTAVNSVDHTHSLTGNTDSAGGSGTNANLPPYYALAFIMKS